MITINDLIPSLQRIQVLFGIFLLCAATGVHAQDTETVKGVPVVQENGTLSIDGQTVALWGIDLLAPDQQCWQGDVAWCCGDHAMTALKHFVENKTIECTIKLNASEGSPALAQCFRFKDGQPQDIADYLVRKGWAIEKSEVSGGAYYQSENYAQTGKYGVWTSRFQTAQDWVGGVQRFVGENVGDAVVPLPASEPAAQQAEADQDKAPTAPVQGVGTDKP